MWNWIARQGIGLLGKIGVPIAIVGGTVAGGAAVTGPGGPIAGLLENAQAAFKNTDAVTDVDNFFTRMARGFQNIFKFITNLPGIISGKVDYATLFSDSNPNGVDNAEVSQGIGAATPAAPGVDGQSPDGDAPAAPGASGPTQNQLVGAASVAVPGALAVMGAAHLYNNHKAANSYTGASPIAGKTNPNGFGTNAKSSFMSAANIKQAATGLGLDVADDAAKVGLRGAFGNAVGALRNMGGWGKLAATAVAGVGALGVVNVLDGEQTPSNIELSEPTNPDTTTTVTGEVAPQKVDLFANPGGWMESLGSDISSVVKEGEHGSELNWNAIGAGSVNNGRALADGAAYGVGGFFGFIADTANVTTNFVGLGGLISDQEKSYTQMAAEASSGGMVSVVGQASYDDSALAQMFNGAGQVGGAVVGGGALVKGVSMGSSIAAKGVGLLQQNHVFNSVMPG